MNNRNKSILYVGAAATEDRALQEGIVKMNQEWRSVFARNADDAWRILGQEEFDAVVSDGKLPDGDGLEFLNRVQIRSPRAPRLLVVDLVDPAATFKFVGGAHHCVPAPWDTTSLSGALRRTFDLRRLLSNENARQLIGKLPRVPSPPNLYFKISKALRSHTADLDEIETLISQDLAITAKLLQLGNSAALGLRSRVTTVGQAIQYLGLEMTRSLVLLAHTFSYFDHVKGISFRLEQLWSHSLNVAWLAQAIAEAEGTELGNEAFLAGLLHDIGKLLLAANLPEDFEAALRRAKEKGVPAWQEEIEKFGATHSEVAGEILATWNFPLSVVEAVALHHHPAQLITQGFSALTSVHVANALTHELSDGITTPIETPYLEALELEERVESWRQIASMRFRTKAKE